MLEPAERRSKPRGASKTNLILAAVLVALALFAYWYELKQKPERQKLEDAKGKLFNFDQTREAESLSILDSIHKTKANFVCERDCKLNSPNPLWNIKQPIEARADDTAVGSFISALSNAVVSETLPLEGDIEKALAGFGLSRDMRGMKSTVIKFKDNTMHYSLYFGDVTAVGDNVYVWATGPGIDSKVVKIIPTYIREYLKRSLSYWRNKKMFTLATSQIDRFVLKNSSGEMEFKKEKGDWFYKDGKQADNEAIDTFLTGVVFLNAKDYVSDNKQADAAKHGVAGKPSSEVKVFTADQPNGIKLSVFDIKKGNSAKIYGTVSTSPSIVEFDKASVDKFSKKSSAFRLKALLTSADKTELAEVQLSLGKAKEKYTFTTQDHQNWTLGKTNIESFDPTSVETALQKIGTARISEFVESKQIPAGTELLSHWIFKTKQGRVIRSFEVLGSTQKGEYFAKFENGDVARLAKAAAANIPARLTDFQRLPDKK